MKCEHCGYDAPERAVICPECGETYLTDFESFEEDDVSCPACGAPFKLEESVLEKLTHDDVDASDKDK